MSFRGVLVAVVALAIFSAGPAVAETVTKLYVPSGVEDEAAVFVYRLESGKLVSTIGVSAGPGAAFINADSSEIWVFSTTGTNCDVISAATDEVIETFDVGLKVFDAAFTPDGKYCFAVGRGHGDNQGTSIMVISCPTYHVAYPIADLVDPAAAAVTPDSKYLYYTSLTAGAVGKVEIPSFEQVTSLTVGLEPSDLELTADGAYLLVACRGLAGGKRGGSQLSVVDCATDQLVWVFNDVGAGVRHLNLAPDSPLIVVTRATEEAPVSDNIDARTLRLEPDWCSINLIQSWRLGYSPGPGLVSPGGDFWVGCDLAEGGVLLAALREGLTPPELELQPGIRPVGLAAIAFDVDERIAAIELRILDAGGPDQVAACFFDIAHLQQLAGRENEEIATYQRIVDDFPGSFAAIEAKLRLGEYGYGKQLYDKAASFTYNALLAYRDFLGEGAADNFLSERSLLAAVARLALISREFEKDYLKDIAKAYLKLSINRPEMAEFFYQLGLELVRQDEKKQAKKCFDEVNNQIANLQDQSQARLMAAKLKLATNDRTTRFRLDRRKDEINVDGLLTEWGKATPLELNSDPQLTYGGDLWLGPEDLSAKLYLAHTDQSLYIAGIVNDDSLMRAGDESGDHIGIYLDLRTGSASFHAREPELGAGCFLIYINSPGGDSPKASVSVSVPTPYQIASVRDLDGYTFELQIPLVTFGEWLPRKDQIFGLGIELVDFDDSLDPELATILGWIAPSSGPAGNIRPTLFGLGRF